MTDRTLFITDEKGVEHKCEILFTYADEETGKFYVVFVTPENSVSAAEVIQDDNGTSGRLQDIQTEAEWAKLEELLNQYAEQQEQQGGSCGSCGGECGGCEGCGGDCECSQDK